MTAVMKTTLFFSLICVTICSNTKFNVIWNVPSRQCQKYGLKFDELLGKYGISINKGDVFQGDEITIFYEPQLGLYPKILENGTDVNGGIPQLGDLNAHLRKAAQDISKVIPDKAFGGLRVIDWEAWRPVWEFNWHPLRIYQTRSKDLVRKQNPDLRNENTIKNIAQKQWEDSAKTWMLKTLELAKKLQPNSVWCFYLFPNCYSYEGNSLKQFLCSENVKKGNDKLSWLWNASTAICPSLYLYESHLQNFTFQQRTWFTNGRLVEALRVADSNAFIYPYVSYSVKPGTMAPKEDFWRIMAQIASLGMKGAVIWGSSASLASRDYCQDLLKYIVQVIGPASEKISWNYNRCSKEVCNGQGACTWPTDEYILAWKLLSDESDPAFYAGDITCRCLRGYSGRFCQRKTLNNKIETVL